VSENPKPKKPLVVERPPVVDSNQRYSLPESFAILRQSPAQGYRDIAAGKLTVFREGRRTYVHGSTLIARARAPHAEVA
jgi:hypothetical protein